MELKKIYKIIADIPEYQAFLTVDELNANTHQLTKKHPTIVEVIPLGKSRAGDPIEAVKIGNGTKNALIFAMPHPNEPIGSMMLDYLSERLAVDDDLRNSMDYTWYLIKCVDPDGTRLNEGWFKGPFSITNYARNYYRPPSHLQVEWTFPIEYKKLNFSSPLPETQALMTLIEETQPAFIYSLHNAGFGGVYFYISEDVEAIRIPFYNLVKHQGLNLHMGESEAPWMTKYADAIFMSPSITQAYDFIELQGGNPGKAITGGTSSWDYAKRFCDPFSLLCEMPYFENKAVHDTTKTDITRRDVILKGVNKTREQFDSLIKFYNVVEKEIISPSPFKDSIENFIKVIPQNLNANENWAKTNPETDAFATKAEILDSLYVKRFYFVLLNMGMIIRMLKKQIEISGSTPNLSQTLEKANVFFNEICAEFEKEMDYSVIPIQKLVQVQLGSALIAASYAAQR
jgi:hypothetical protein